MQRKTPNEIDKTPTNTGAPTSERSDFFTDLYAKPTGVRHPLGRSIPKNSPLLKNDSRLA